jgi:hypothetical protein
MIESGAVMNFRRLAFWVALGLAADGMLAAQSLPSTQPLLVASEALPGGGQMFPELFSGSHNALVTGLVQGLPLTPALSSATPIAPDPEAPAPRLTGKDRLTLFWNTTYASPGAFAGLAAGAFIDQVRHTPVQWDRDGSGYTRRFASEYGQLATRNVVHEGLAALTGLDPRYPVCHCDGTLRRSGHALKMTFTTYRQDGRLTLDMPQLMGAYGSGIVSAYWYPHHLYSPLVQGVQFGHEQMGEVLVGNLVQEFGPSIQKALHLHALTARRVARSDDED